MHTREQVLEGQVEFPAQEPVAGQERPVPWPADPYQVRVHHFFLERQGAESLNLPWRRLLSVSRFPFYLHLEPPVPLSLYSLDIGPSRSRKNLRTGPWPGCSSWRNRRDRIRTPPASAGTDHTEP